MMFVNIKHIFFKSVLVLSLTTTCFAMQDSRRLHRAGHRVPVRAETRALSGEERVRMTTLEAIKNAERVFAIQDERFFRNKAHVSPYQSAALTLVGQAQFFILNALVAFSVLECATERVREAQRLAHDMSARPYPYVIWLVQEKARVALETIRHQLDVMRGYAGRMRTIVALSHLGAPEHRSAIAHVQQTLQTALDRAVEMELSASQIPEIIAVYTSAAQA